MTCTALKQNEIHLWYQSQDVCLTQSQTQQCLSKLSPEEQKIFATIISSAKKKEYLLTRKLVRNVLSRYANVKPFDWQFTKNKYGCPQIKNHLEFGLTFNISHCSGLIVCAVALTCELGVDVELVKENQDLIDLAKNNFSANEFKKLKNLTGKVLAKKFFEVWTLKEAYIKARKLGLSLSTKLFSFEVESKKIQLVTQKDIDTNTDKWQFITKSIAATHQVSIAVRSFQPNQLKITETWVD